MTHILALVCSLRHRLDSRVHPNRRIAHLNKSCGGENIRLAVFLTETNCRRAQVRYSGKRFRSRKLSYKLGRRRKPRCVRWSCLISNGTSQGSIGWAHRHHRLVEILTHIHAA